MNRDIVDSGIAVYEREPKNHYPSFLFIFRFE